ncbi:MAG: MarR family transcriptional regulator [Sulfitobacter sp.]
MTKPIEQTRREFIEKIGLIAQVDGLPRIAGRVLGLLVWDGEAVAFGDIASQLLVSRGSVSAATRILEDRRLIKRTTRAGDRQYFFQLSERPYESMMEGIASSLALNQKDIDETVAEIPEEEAEIKARITEYSRFYQGLSKAVSTMINEMG